LSKKKATRRKENFKAFREGQVKAREKFIDKKLVLIEELLSDEKKKEALFSKKLKEMDNIERAAVSSMTMKPITLEDFQSKKEDLKKEQITSAKHKYSPKLS